MNRFFTKQQVVSDYHLPVHLQAELFRGHIIRRQSGRPFFMRFVAAVGLKASGSNEPPAHSSNSSCCSLSSFWMASTKLV